MSANDAARFIAENTSDRRYSTEGTCQTCDGAGDGPDGTCWKCNGSGVTSY